MFTSEYVALHCNWHQWPTHALLQTLQVFRLIAASMLYHSHLTLPAVLPARLPTSADSCLCCLFPLCFLLCWLLALLPGLCLRHSMIRVHAFACDCGGRYLHFVTNANIAHIQVSNSNQIKGMKGLLGRGCCASVPCCSAVPMWKRFQAVQCRILLWVWH